MAVYKMYLANNYEFKEVCLYLFGETFGFVDNLRVCNFYS